MLVALRGITWVMVGNLRMIQALDIGWFSLVNMRVLGLPLFFLLAIGVTLIAALIVTKTRTGRHVQAVGGDDRAAARAGISVGRVRTGALLLSAVGAGEPAIDAGLETP